MLEKIKQFEIKNINNILGGNGGNLEDGYGPIQDNKG